MLLESAHANPSDKDFIVCLSTEPQFCKPMFQHLSRQTRIFQGTRYVYDQLQCIEKTGTSSCDMLSVSSSVLEK